jgi:hypothetical protein
MHACPVDMHLIDYVEGPCAKLSILVTKLSCLVFNLSGS